MKKILIIRYSSIGDIILTTPVIRMIKNQLQAELHFLTKKTYACIIESNPYVSKVHQIETELDDILINILKEENFDCVIDLQKNFRSMKVKRVLKLPTYSFSKENVKKWLLIKFNLRFLKIRHVVYRYMDTVSSIGVQPDEEGLDYFIPKSTRLNFSEKNFLAWCIGGSFEEKKLSVNQVVEVLSNFKQNVVLLGGKEEFELGEHIIKKCNNPMLYNLCGSLSLHETAKIIQKSQLLLTNDTGLMHIGSAFKKIIISFWGCTQPSLGFSPYGAATNSIEISGNISGIPCSKHGKFCRNSSIGCIKNISSNEIFEALKKLEY